MTPQLFHSPFACSLACRFALAEADIPHELVVVNLASGENQSEAFKKINPRGKVPVLNTGDGVLTESSAIIAYIADLAPGHRLLPRPGTFARARAHSWLAYLSGTLHPCYTGIFRPALFTTDADGLETVKAAHLERLTKAFVEIDAHLARETYLLGEYSLCDAALAVFSSWRMGPAVAGKLPPLQALDAHQARVLARPAIAPIFQDDVKRRTAAAPPA